MKVLSDVEERGVNAMCHVVDSMTKKIKEMYLKQDKAHLLQKGKFFIISNVDIGTAINIKDNSKVIKGLKESFFIWKTEIFTYFLIGFTWS